MASAALLPARTGHARALVLLLGVAIFINYVDRGNLATAGPLIKTEMGLTNTQFGLLVSAFFWTYAPSQLLAGWLAQRYCSYRVLAAGLALWAVATMMVGLVHGDPLKHNRRPAGAGRRLDIQILELRTGLT